MKRVLITGTNSYVGAAVEKWLKKEPNKYNVHTLDMKNSNWIDFDFSKFDVIFHVAGIAHVSNKKTMKDLYYRVNRDLTIKVAKKAKNDGVEQFIFMSSMIVYNSSEKLITRATLPNPNNFYGRSKLEAEEVVLDLCDNDFLVSIIRSPMIYGPNSKGNFLKLLRIVKRIRVFPKIHNKRSMIYIDNLCEFVKKKLEYTESGIFFPQNRETVSTCELVNTIADGYNIKMYNLRIINPLIKFLRLYFVIFEKVFGDSFYDLSLSQYNFEYQIVSFKESIVKSIEG